MNFPKVELNAPITVSRANVFPEENICIIGNREKVAEIVTHLSVVYESGWKRSYVSLATKYRVAMDGAEILLLDRGIAVTVQDPDGKRATYSRGYGQGSAEEIVRYICEFANARKAD